MTTWLTAAQVCEALQISPTTLWRLTQRGEIAYRRWGKGIVRYPSTVVEYLPTDRPGPEQQEATCHLPTSIPEPRGDTASSTTTEAPDVSGRSRRRKKPKASSTPWGKLKGADLLNPD